MVYISDITMHGPLFFFYLFSWKSKSEEEKREKPVTWFALSPAQNLVQLIKLEIKLKHLQLNDCNELVGEKTERVITVYFYQVGKPG